MIKMLRIDDRLIHGQIAVVWSKELGVDRIVVANDKVAVNDVQKATLNGCSGNGEMQYFIS